MKLSKISHTLTMASTVVLLTACGGSSSDGISSGNASLSLGLVDAAVDDALNVLVYVKGVQMHSPSGEDIKFQFCADDLGVDVEVDVEVDGTVNADAGSSTELSVEESPMSATCQTPESREIDLLRLTGGTSVDLLDGVSVPPGRYPWIRLELDENRPSQLVRADGTYELTVPSGANNGLKINTGFTATINGTNEFLIDFDLRKSVHESGTGYKLRPTLRLIKIENVGKQRLTGDWDVAAMGPDCAAPMAYVFEGQNASPVDLGTVEGEVVTTANFVADDDGTRYKYKVDYLAYGDYTVAYTCNGDKDDSAIAGEDLDFVEPTQNVTVGG